MALMLLFTFLFNNYIVTLKLTHQNIAQHPFRNITIILVTDMVISILIAIFSLIFLFDTYLVALNLVLVVVVFALLKLGAIILNNFVFGELSFNMFFKSKNLTLVDKITQRKNTKFISTGTNFFESKKRLIELTVFILFNAIALVFIFAFSSIYETEDVRAFFTLFDMSRDYMPTAIKAIIISLFFFLITGYSQMLLVRILTITTGEDFSEEYYNFNNLVNTLDRLVIFLCLAFSYKIIMLGYYILKAIILSYSDRDTHDVVILSTSISLIITLLGFSLYEYILVLFEEFIAITSIV